MFSALLACVISIPCLDQPQIALQPVKYYNYDPLVGYDAELDLAFKLYDEDAVFISGTQMFSVVEEGMLILEGIVYDCLAIAAPSHLYALYMGLHPAEEDEFAILTPTLYVQAEVIAVVPDDGAGLTPIPIDINDLVIPKKLKEIIENPGVKETD